MQRFYHMITYKIIHIVITYIDQTLIRFVMDQCGIHPYSDWGRPKEDSIFETSWFVNTDVFLFGPNDRIVYYDQVRPEKQQWIG